MSVRRICHIQLGRGGGTERFFVNLLSAFADAGAVQMAGLREGINYLGDVTPHAEVIQGPLLHFTPQGLWARARLQRAMARFQPDAILGWRGPTARLIPAKANAVKLVRLGDYPAHAKHFPHLDAVICNNPDIARHVAGLGHPGRIELISNFARPVTPAPLRRADWDTPEGAFLVCGAGRFAQNKGFDLLIRAAAEIPEAWLWLVGEGEERSALEALVDKLNMRSRTRFLGWQDEPMNAVAAADAFVMPSREEPLGNALIEAFHAGTASVSTATNGPCWYGEGGRDCLIVPIDDAPAMSAALLRLQQDADLRASLVSGGRATLAERFSRDAVRQSYFDLIDALA